MLLQLLHARAAATTSAMPAQAGSITKTPGTDRPTDIQRGPRCSIWSSGWRSRSKAPARRRAASSCMQIELGHGHGTQPASGEGRQRRKPRRPEKQRHPTRVCPSAAFDAACMGRFEARSGRSTASEIRLTPPLRTRISRSTARRVVRVVARRLLSSGGGIIGYGSLAANTRSSSTQPAAGSRQQARQRSPIQQRTPSSISNCSWWSDLGRNRAVGH